MNEGTTFLKSEKEMKLRKWFWQLISLFSLNKNIFFCKGLMVAKVTTRHETTNNVKSRLFKTARSEAAKF